MREIKFRGKRVDNGEWVYGYLVKTKDTTYICYDEQFDDDLFFSPKNIFIPVIPETVGQFTGLHDKNDKEVYEGDICDTHTDFGKGIVKWESGMFKINYISLCTFSWKIEVIGNIFEDGGLLDS